MAPSPLEVTGLGSSPYWVAVACEATSEFAFVQSFDDMERKMQRGGGGGVGKVMSISKHVSHSLN